MTNHSEACVDRAVSYGVDAARLMPRSSMFNMTRAHYNRAHSLIVRVINSFRRLHLRTAVRSGPSDLE